jgi:BirA family biotin operon repressor/biotin-[acetyl-CoA-carboxylase] ligase
VGLDELTHDPVDREDVLRLWLDALERGVAAGPALVPAYRGCCTTLGQQVRVVQPGGELHGLAADIDDRGRLVVDTDGGLVAVDVGDVTHVRT